MKSIISIVLPFLCLLYFPAFSHSISFTGYNGNPLPADSLPATAIPLKDISDHRLRALGGGYTRLNKLMMRDTEKALQRMEKKELALQNKLQQTDSLKAKALFSGTHEKYAQLLQQLNTKPPFPAETFPLKEYVPGIDSMQTALRFLQHLPLQHAQAAGSQLQALQGTLQKANNIQAFIREREQQLKDQLSHSGLGKQLLGINQEAYYYQARLAEYKSTLNDPDKLQRALLSAVRQSPYFQRFWQQHSYWSRLFPAPVAEGTPQALAGLQTRDQVKQDVQKKLGTSATAGTGGGVNGENAYLQQQMQQASAKLDAIKARLAQLGAQNGGAIGNSNMTMPDFTPNTQHTRTFLRRLQYSFTIQNTAGNALLPAMSSLGINIGYKLSDKSTVGIGGSYLLGLGNGWDHIRLSNQGCQIRSYMDIRAKGSIWITGGLEYNYLQHLAAAQSLLPVDAWRKSALIGLTKKYRIGKKENNLQLLYDLLANSAVPKAPSFHFRMGWGF